MVLKTISMVFTTRFEKLIAQHIYDTNKIFFHLTSYKIHFDEFTSLSSSMLIIEFVQKFE